MAIRVVSAKPSDGERLWAESEELVQSCRESIAAGDEDEVIDAICRAARRLTGADGACLILREGERVHYAREDSVAPLWAGQRFPIDDCISGWSILHREAVVIEDVYADERIPLDCYRNTFVKSLAMQPIEPSNPIGSIGVYWSARRRAAERELALLEKLAEVAAVVLEGVTSRRQLRAVSGQAEEAIRLKDDFLAMVSHELRSPLHSILGWTALLRMKKSDAAVLDRAIEVIEENARAQARLLEDLLDVSRIATAKLQLDVGLVDLERLVRKALDAVDPAARRKGIALETAIAAVGTVWGDETRLGQVVRNLLDNAIKFTPERGCVRVGVQRHGSRVRITVTDDGIGIARELLPFVFDRHRQGDGAARGAGQGLGLGLMIARQIVELHGGGIEAHSDGDGRGATFTVELSSADGQAPPASGAPLA
jgi:two-component system CheB/CheR fusion protein